MNRLQQLTDLGQSIWYDQMQRSLLTGGKLRKMITEDSLRGLTSNPTIFDKAISGTSEYDDALGTLAREGRSATEIYEALVYEDIGGAADAFRPVWEETKGRDGYVSLEVDPRLAHDTQGTIAEAKRHFHELGRPNVMIKIPATPEGMPAIEEVLARGINVNVTLIFSRKVYGDVMDAYLRGLERRARDGKPIDSLASVASFFVSRIDSKVDKALGEISGPGAAALAGTIAIANAKMAYQDCLSTFRGERWDGLAAKGARVQRPLWASTSTKNPAYKDVIYVDELIGRDTVNTLPPATFDAFRDHGIPELTIERDLEAARGQLASLESIGISLDRVTDELTMEGVRSFADSFESLMRTIEARRAGTAVTA